MTTDINVGVAYVPGLEPLLESRDSCIDILEVEPQTHWQHRPGTSKPYRMPNAALDYLCSLPQKKLVHSIGFAVGGSHVHDKELIDTLAATIGDLAPEWASEHLSVTHINSEGGLFHSGFMLPSLQTPAGVAAAVNSITAMKNGIHVPFAVETAVNYLKPRKGELDDGEFVARVVEQADCGILLDLHNIWTNEKNGRQSVEDYLAQIPLDRVWEIHLAGGFSLDGYWLDAHSGEVPKKVMDLFRYIIPALPSLKAVIFEIFPSFIPLFGLPQIENQIKEIKQACRETLIASPVNSLNLNRGNSIKRNEEVDNSLSASEWEATLGELVTFGAPRGNLAKELAADPALPLLQKLVWKFRAGAITKALKTLVQLLFLYLPENKVERLLGDYFSNNKPTPFASDEAIRFLEYLEQQDLDVIYLNDIIRYERALIAANIKGKDQTVRFSVEPLSLITAIQKGQLLTNPIAGDYELEIPASLFTDPFMEKDQALS